MVKLLSLAQLTLSHYNTSAASGQQLSRLEFFMSELRHPDLEIYIKSRSAEQVIEWLEKVCDSVQVLTKTATSCELELQFGEQYMSASLQQKVSGKAWSSLWFKSNPTPWNTDLDCALVASEHMATQIRCIKASWEDNEQDDQSEEQWWRVEEREQQLISWHS